MREEKGLKQLVLCKENIRVCGDWRMACGLKSRSVRREENEGCSSSLRLEERARLQISSLKHKTRQIWWGRVNIAIKDEKSDFFKIP